MAWRGNSIWLFIYLSSNCFVWLLASEKRNQSPAKALNSRWQNSIIHPAKGTVGHRGAAATTPARFAGTGPHFEFPDTPAVFWARKNFWHPVFNETHLVGRAATRPRMVHIRLMLAPSDDHRFRRISKPAPLITPPPPWKPESPSASIQWRLKFYVVAAMPSKRAKILVNLTDDSDHPDKVSGDFCYHLRTNGNLWSWTTPSGVVQEGVLLFNKSLYTMVSWSWWCTPVGSLVKDEKRERQSLN